MTRTVHEVRLEVERLAERSEAQARRIQSLEERMERIHQTVEKLWTFRWFIVAGMSLLGGGKDGLKLVMEWMR